MLINVVIKRTANSEFLGYNILIHDAANEEAKYTARTKIKILEGVDFYIGATENRYANMLPIVKFLKNNMDILGNIEASIDDYAKLIAATLAAEFKCAARAGKD